MSKKRKYWQTAEVNDVKGSWVICFAMKIKDVETNRVTAVCS
jgi:hypothetical protein